MDLSSTHWSSAGSCRTETLFRNYQMTCETADPTLFHPDCSGAYNRMRRGTGSKSKNGRNKFRSRSAAKISVASVDPWIGCTPEDVVALRERHIAQLPTFKRS